MRPVLRDSRGVSLIEVLVALVIFALFLLTIDAVFSAARRGTAKAGLSADVQQNARIAVDRLTREVREATTGNVVIGGIAGARAIAFKSARPKGSPTVFCVDVDTINSPLYNAACSPPLKGTFTPVWKSVVGYYVVSASGGGYNLQRYVCTLNSPSDPLPADPASPSGDCTTQTIAAFVESFDLSPLPPTLPGPLTGKRLSVVLKATGQETGQETTQAVPLSGSLPAQEILVEGTAELRN